VIQVLPVAIAKYELYTLREAPNDTPTPPEFAAVQNAPVESMTRYLIDEADAIVYNWFGVDDYRFVVKELIADLRL
jgi:hypothetical protein